MPMLYLEVMKRWEQKRTGFTIVELLIVVVVIAILAAITIVSYNGITRNAQNSERVSDISAIQKALELHYVDNGNYPKQGPVVGMDTELPVTILKLPRSAIIAPGAPEGTQNSISENSYGHSMNVNSYGYRAINASNGACWSSADTCTSYKLYYRLDGEMITKTLAGGTNINGF